MENLLIVQIGVYILIKYRTGTLHHGDCLEVMKTLPDDSVDAVVNDENPVKEIFASEYWTNEKCCDSPAIKYDNNELDLLYADQPELIIEKASCDNCGQKYRIILM